MGIDSGPVAGTLVTIERDDPRPLHEQLEQALRAGIRSGRLAAGTRLPSTRALSTQLGVSRGVVSGAYGQLAAEGYLSMRQGAPVRVSDAIALAIARPAARSLAVRFAYDLRPGLPDLAGFPRGRWHRALSAGWRQAPTDAMGDLDPRGAPELRTAVGAYLDRVRGTAADPELMLISTGFRQGLSLACRWLANYGAQRVAVEDPGWHPHRLIIEQSGLTVVPVAVDRDGLDPDALEAAGVTAVVVTPAHQFPTGAVLSPTRRSALLHWAERNDALIIEDDYDSELRFDGIAPGALQGLAPDRVLYIGSASKRLAPALRLGWALLPSWLTWPMVSGKAVEDNGTELLGQLALAELIASGELDRHLRRMRQRYAIRRQTLLEALHAHLPGARTCHDPAGLHENVALPADIDEPRLLAAAARRGVGVEALSQHRYSTGGRPGLLVGYANVSEPALHQAIHRLAAAVAELT